MVMRKPVVRHFIACEKAETFSATKQYSLHKLIYSIRPEPGVAYPRIQPEINLFAVLTDAQGECNVTIELVTWEGLEERSIWNSGSVILDLGPNPLRVHGWIARLKDIMFRRPGLYEFRLMGEGEVLAREPILLRESQ